MKWSITNFTSGGSPPQYLHLNPSLESTAKRSFFVIGCLFIIKKAPARGLPGCESNRHVRAEFSWVGRVSAFMVINIYRIPAPVASAISRVVISGSFPRASLMRERKGAFRFRVIPG
jgi:hypothetical protein